MSTFLPRTVVNIRCPVEDKALWQAAAKQAGTDLSSWIRFTLHSAATMNGMCNRCKRLGKVQGCKYCKE